MRCVQETMTTTLDPIDKDGSAFRVFLNGKRIGLVTKNTSLGGVIWHHRVAVDADPVGVFTEAQEAADQLAANHVSRKKRKM